jgi:PH domain
MSGVEGAAQCAFPGIRTKKVLPDTEVVVKSGMLQKRGEKVKSWTTRLFELTSHTLTYYQVTGASRVLKGSVPLAGSRIQACTMKTTKLHTFELCCPHRTYLISAASGFVCL